MQFYIQKNAFVGKIMREIIKKRSLSPNSRIRLYEVMNHKIQKEYTGTEPIDKIQDFTTLYAEVDNYFNI